MERCSTFARGAGWSGKPWTGGLLPCSVRPGLLRVVLAAVALATPGRVVASEAPPGPSLQLEWSAPATCPGAEAVRGMASALLGAPVVATVAASTQVRARVQASAGGFVLTIETRSRGGTDRRRLQDPRCSVLAEAAALIAAAAADPSLAGRPGASAGVAEGTGGGAAPGTAPTVPPPPGSGDVDPGTGDMSSGTGDGSVPSAVVIPGDLSPGTGGTRVVPVDLSPGAGGVTVPPPGDMSRGTGGVNVPPAGDLSPGTGVPPEISAEVEPAAKVDAPASRPGPARTRLGLRLGGVFDVGSVRAPTGGLALTGAVFGRLWRAELGGLWLAPRTSWDPESAAGAKVGLFAAALRGCVVPRLGRLEMPVCGGLEGGVVRGRGVGTTLASRVDSVPWLAVGVGPGLVWSVRPWLALGVQVDLVVPVVATKFTVVKQGVPDIIYEGSPAAGRAALAVEWRFR